MDSDVECAIAHMTAIDVDELYLRVVEAVGSYPNLRATNLAGWLLEQGYATETAAGLSPTRRCLELAPY